MLVPDTTSEEEFAGASPGGGGTVGEGDQTALLVVDLCFRVRMQGK